MKNFVVVKETYREILVEKNGDKGTYTWVNVEDPFVLNCSMIEKINSFSFSDTKEVVFHIITTNNRDFYVCKKTEIKRILDAMDIDINDFISKKYKEEGDGYIEPSREPNKLDKLVSKKKTGK